MIMAYKIIEKDPWLAPYEKDIALREALLTKTKKKLFGKNKSTKKDLLDFANGHEYFGFHPIAGGWVYREWAPGADAVYLTGDFCEWDITACPMEKRENGVFEITLQGEDAPKAGEFVQAVILRGGEYLRRVPSYATRVVQDETTYLWCAQLEDTLAPYNWNDAGFVPAKTPLIYECHIGMAQDKYGVGSYEEFRLNILPRIKDLGYNTIQIMAIMEHPYYGSFGYQVSNFFAPSSRYGKSEDLKRLIDTAHSMGITVLLDVVHSHAVKNVGEGLNLFDGTEYQYFREGARGYHPAWDTKLFDYGKPEVLHFLLSNLKYWMDIFHFDGFRFDGVTSMLYHDHGLGAAFTNYGMYFSENTDTEAVTYLQLANELVHAINPRALTVAEDMSGMPGMCLPIKEGGIGFDYRLAMGVPDFWIKLLKEVRDENWDVGHIYHELTNRRAGEKTIGYAESHDQALVGDKTIMFRLCDAEMYSAMGKNTESLVIDRGMALHKMIRLITASLAGEGYLNFMGNEFGHPEWIDFPREGNGWSYHYCRRQWHLCDDESLRFGALSDFDKEMITLLQKKRLFEKAARQILCSGNDKVLIYEKGDLLFAFNFHPEQSYEGYFIPLREFADYQVLFSTDDCEFGGKGRVDKAYRYHGSGQKDRGLGFYCYLPSRCAIVFGKKKTRCKK